MTVHVFDNGAEAFQTQVTRAISVSYGLIKPVPSDHAPLYQAPYQVGGLPIGEI